MTVAAIRQPEIVAGHTRHMLRTSTNEIAACECLWIGPRRSALQLAYTDHIIHLDLLQGRTKSDKVSGMNTDASSADRLAVYRSFLRDLANHERHAPEALTDTDALGDATEAFCENCQDEQGQGFLVGSNPLPALEIVAQHRLDYPGHHVLFLEPTLEKD